MRIYLNIIGLLLLLFIIVILESILPNKICVYLAKNKLLAVGECNNRKAKEGVWIYKYTEDGNLWAIGSYKNNKMNSIWKEFYDDTLHTLRSVTYYYQDKANGMRYVYDKDGFLINKQICKNDKIIKEWSFYKDTVYDVKFPMNASVTIPNLYDYEADKVFIINSYYNTLKLAKIVIVSVLLFINILYNINKKHFRY